MSKKLKKLKTAQLQRNALIRELARLFINNPHDLTTSPLNVDDYYSITKAAEIITSHTEYQIIKDSHEWDYFATKWNALLNFRAEDQLNDYQTYHDVFSDILKEWENIKQSPYTYRCIASLIRMLGDE